MVLAILDGEHALYKVGQRLDERGMCASVCGMATAVIVSKRLGRSKHVWREGLMGCVGSSPIARPIVAALLACVRRRPPGRGRVS